MKFFLLITLFIPLSLSAQTHKYYFYNPHAQMGSEYIFNPANSFLNGAFDILRNGGHSKDITAVPYKIGAKNVWDNLTHPIESIKQYGVSYFLSEEVFPISIRKDKAQYFPNYMHHMLGGGMLYVKTAEWYEHNGFPFPKTASLITATAYQFLNEVIENSTYEGNNTDPIADMLIFNPLGYLLFEFDSVKRFFSQKVILQDWSPQPVITPRNNFIENAGQQFVLKFDPGWFENYSGFFYWGIYGISGITYSKDKVNNFSVGAGTVVNKLIKKERRKSRLLVPQIDGALGFFYDVEHSLVASLLITGPNYYNARLNIYPGLVDFYGIKPGLYIGYGQLDKLIAGVTIAHIPIGISFEK